MPATKGNFEMKTRYTIIEPGKIRIVELDRLEWHEIEFKTDEPTIEELSAVLDPLFPDGDFERVAVNSFKGPADMFVDDMGIRKNLEPNDAATLIYWTASGMHELATADQVDRIDIDPVELRKRALDLAATRLTIDTETPRILGRAVLFDDRVWF